MFDALANLLDALGDLAVAMSLRDDFGAKSKSGGVIATLPPLPKPPILAKAPGGEARCKPSASIAAAPGQ